MSMEQEKVSRIKSMINDGIAIKEIAKNENLNLGTIYNINRGYLAGEVEPKTKKQLIEEQRLKGNI